MPQIISNKSFLISFSDRSRQFRHPEEKNPPALLHNTWCTWLDTRVRRVLPTIQDTYSPAQ